MWGGSSQVAGTTAGTSTGFVPQASAHLDEQQHLKEGMHVLIRLLPAHGATTGIGL